MTRPKIPNWNDYIELSPVDTYILLQDFDKALDKVQEDLDDLKEELDK